MKSEKAKEYMASLSCEVFPKRVGRPEAIEVCEIAEQEAEERIRRKAVNAFCDANCPEGCSLCGAKKRFIQKLNEE